MTRETLRRLVELGLNNKQCIKKYFPGAHLPGNSDDIILGESFTRFAN